MEMLEKQDGYHHEYELQAAGDLPPAAGGSHRRTSFLNWDGDAAAEVQC
jgi:hypothetical protein